MNKAQGRFVYEFGDFQVDPVQRLLSLQADGRPLPLASRAFETLLYFLEHPGELLDKLTLMTAIWPNAVVEENNLNQSITAIRRVLGEIPGEHRFIVTVPGRGYRFVAEVRKVAAQSPDVGTAATQANATSAPKVHSRWFGSSKARIHGLRYLAGFLLLLALSYYVIDYLLLSPAPSVPARREIDPSIAVLRFENRSEDPTNAYFTAGVQDEILTLLSKIGALRVISRASGHSANAPANLPEIAQQLGVAHFLQGSVQKVGDRVRINVQLIDAATNKHLWAETYERKLTDVFAVETEVAQAVAETLRAKLTGAEQRELAMKPTENSEAYDAYLRGLSIYLRVSRTESEIRSAAAAFEDAVRLDPNFAVAWARLATRNILLFSLNHDRSASRREAARQALEAAVRLRPDLTETQLALGHYRYRIEEDYEGAKQIFAQIRQKSPNNADAAYALALIARLQGRWQESFALFEEAIALDPQNAFTRAITCETYVATRQFADALKTCNRALKLLPGDAGVLITKATIYQGLGELDRADTVLAGLQPAQGHARALSVLSYQAVLQRRYPAAIALLQSHLANPEVLGSQVGGQRRWLGDLQRLAGDAASAKASYLQARDELQAQLKTQPDNFALIAELGLVYAGLQDQQTALRYAERADALRLKAKSASRIVRVEEIPARVEARFGDNDRAIAALQRLLAVPGGFPPLTPALLRLDPDWDGLRNDSRFQQLVAADKSVKP